LSNPDVPRFVGGRLLAGALFAAVLALTVAIYAAGLHGPYLLDDIGNLEPLKRWVDGALGWRGVVFDNRSGPGGRPLSMLSFLANAWIAPDLDTFGFKATNLAIHIACGGLAFALVRALFAQGGIATRHAVLLAAFVATAWLWLPLQVSTVLYVIQRMTQLATLLVFATLVLYLWGRVRVASAPRMSAAVLWLAVPTVTLLAACAKETGLLAIPLAAAIEYSLFDRRTRPRHVNAFFALTVALPVLAGLVFLSLRPDWILKGYAARDFTLPQRLMTEPRVLWAYLQTTFFPVGPRMGLFHDAYPASTGLLAPWTTAIALLAWGGTIVAAFVLRRRAPLFTVGVAGFLVAHALESGPIGLELYFEHRNYGAALFALVAAVGLLRLALGSSIGKPRVRRAMVACAVACLAIYGLGTLNQAQGWSNAPVFYAMQYDYNPDSPRLLSNLTGRALMAHDLDGALRYIAAGERAGPDAERMTATIWRFLAYCDVDAAPAPASLYDEFAERSQGRITSYAMVGWELLANHVVDGCQSVDRVRLVGLAKAWLARTRQPGDDQAVWRTRFNTGRIAAQTGDIADARVLVHEAWLDSDRNNGIGVLLFQLDASAGDVAGCREVLAALQRSEGGADRRLNEAVATFRAALASGQIAGKDP